MTGIIQTKFGTIDASNYPIIKVAGNEKLPNGKDIENFLSQLSNVMKHNHGPFVLFADARNMTAMSREAREILAVGLRHLEDVYAGRYRKFVFYIPKIHLIILQKMVTLVVKPAVSQKVFYREKKAFNYLERLKHAILNE